MEPPPPPCSDAAPSGIGAALAARIVAVAAETGTSPAEPASVEVEAAPEATAPHVAADAPPPATDTPAVDHAADAGAMAEDLHPFNGGADPAEAPPPPPPPPLDPPRARVAYTHTPCTTADRPGPGVLPVLCNNRPGWLLLPPLDDTGALADLPRVECGCRACSTYPHRPALTLPDYEKHAGAAHNKKWRTSVRVVGEVGGAHAPEALAGGALGAAAALHAGPPLGVWLEDRGLWDAAKHARSGRPSPATSDADASRGGTPPALSPRGDRKRRAPGWLADTVTSSSLRLPHKSGKGGAVPPPPPPLAPPPPPLAPPPPPAVFGDDDAAPPASSELRIVHYRPTPGGGLYLEVALDGRLYGGEVARARGASGGGGGVRSAGAQPLAKHRRTITPSSSAAAAGAPGAPRATATSAYGAPGGPPLSAAAAAALAAVAPLPRGRGRPAKAHPPAPNPKADAKRAAVDAEFARLAAGDGPPPGTICCLCSGGAETPRDGGPLDASLRGELRSMAGPLGPLMLVRAAANQIVWCHEQCAAWSSEVHVDEGFFKEVAEACRRGRMIKCSVCASKGATLGCAYRTCAKSYHLACARRVGCSLTPDGYCRCPSHSKKKTAEVKTEKVEGVVAAPVAAAPVAPAGAPDPNAWLAAAAAAGAAAAGSVAAPAAPAAPPPPPPPPPPAAPAAPDAHAQAAQAILGLLSGMAAKGAGMGGGQAG